MNKEERKAIEDMNRFANGIDMSCVTARQMQIISNLIEKMKKCINILDDELKERNKTINEKEIIIEKLQKETEEKDKQIKKALDLIFEYGQIDGGHHKAWVIDQIVRILIKDKYDEWVKNYIYDEETGDTYTWDKGIAP